jgi:hypothetical protein
MPSASGMAHHAAAFEPLANVVATIAGNVMVQGTDRSRPPAVMTAPCPSPRIARKLQNVSSVIRYVPK